MRTRSAPRGGRLRGECGGAAGHGPGHRRGTGGGRSGGRRRAGRGRGDEQRVGRGARRRRGGPPATGRQRGDDIDRCAGGGGDGRGGQRRVAPPRRGRAAGTLPRAGSRPAGPGRHGSASRRRRRRPLTGGPCGDDGWWYPGATAGGRGEARVAVTAPFPSATLDATLERITYANEDTGYTVAKVDTGRGADLLTVVGSLLGAQPGEALRLRGRWGSHPQYGRQFHVEDYTTVLPATVQGVRRYLGSGLIKGIGPKLAEKIVDHFGVAALDVIETAPRRLVEVPNLGPKRTRLITDAWQQQKAIKEVMVFLQGVGVSTSLAVRIYKQYADASIGVVRTAPYRLAADVWGIGFTTADTIAQAVGIPHDSPQRVQAGLQFTLSEATSDGHCFLPEQDLIGAAVKILQVDLGPVSYTHLTLPTKRIV